MGPPRFGPRYCFGDFELDSRTGELSKNGAAIKLQPQPARALVLLVSRAGGLVTREELRENLWPAGTTVEFDHGLNYCIRQIRSALGDSAGESTYIETLPKRGYRFLAPVDEIDENETPGAPPAPLPVHPTRKIRMAPAGWLAAAASIAILVYWGARADTRLDGPKAILVRPLIPLGLDPGDAWYGDALTQQIITALAETKKVRVLPWSTSLALKQSASPVRELGKRYGADAIVEGSVQRTGKRLRVSAQLIDTATERVLWSHQDERESPDLGGIEGGVLSSLAQALKFRIDTSDVPVARRRPEDIETYNLYLRAIAQGDQFSAAGSARAIANLEEVIRRAPGYAPAYAQLANVLVVVPFHRPVPAMEALKEATRLAERAIALDPGLADAHTALAHAWFNRWRWREAETEFRTALSLDPNSSPARQLYGLFLASQGRFDEAVAQETKAMELAPASGLIAYSTALVFLHSGRADEAIAAGRHAIEIDPAFRQGYQAMARAFQLKGMFKEAIEANDALGRAPAQQLWRARYLALDGKRDEAHKLLRQWEAANPHGRQPLAYGLALLACGDENRGFAALRLAVTGHTPSAVWLNTTPELKPYRNDPRLAAVVDLLNTAGR